MSTITITPLVIGETADSADVNATLSSFNAATAAAQLGSNNVRFEGIDRRTMDADTHVVGSAAYGNNTSVAITTTGPIANATALYVVVPGLITASLTIPTTAKCLLHASVGLDNPDQAAGPMVLVDCILQRSDDVGVSWADLAGTRRRIQMRDTIPAALSVNQPGIKASISWTVRITPTGAAALYRVGYKTVNGNITFTNGTIFPEPFGA